MRVVIDDVAGSEAGHSAPLTGVGHRVLDAILGMRDLYSSSGAMMHSSCSKLCRCCKAADGRGAVPLRYRSDSTSPARAKLCLISVLLCQRR